MSLVLAIDQSTSATKALLFDRAGRVVARAARAHRQIYPRPGYVEHDAEEIYRNLLAVAADVARGGAGDEVALVSLTNQRETVVVFDRATGRPLHNAVVWQCRRGEAVCAALRAAGHEAAVTARTGLKLDPYFSASKVAWLARHEPDVARRLRAGDAVAGTVDAYLLHRLTGGRTLATDATNACRTLLLDIARGAWDADLCRLFDVPPHALPEVRDSTARFGETDLGGALPRPVPICGVMGDSQAALLAQRCLRPGDAKVTFGSGSSVLLTAGPVPGIPEGDRGTVVTIAWAHAGRRTYCHEGIINYSAATLAWLTDGLGLLTAAAESEAVAATVPDTGGVYVVPAFAGLGAPYWRPDARAAVVGLTSHAGRAHVVRAALEAMAYQVRDVLDMMRRKAGVDLGAISADGGPTRNRLLMQFLADVLRLTVHASDVPDCSPLGAAMAGMVGIGWVGSLDALADLPREVTTYRPAMPPGQADRLYAGWQAAVRQVLAGCA